MLTRNWAQGCICGETDVCAMWRLSPKRFGVVACPTCGRCVERKTLDAAIAAWNSTLESYRAHLNDGALFCPRYNRRMRIRDKQQAADVWYYSHQRRARSQAVRKHKIFHMEVIRDETTHS